MLASKLPDLRSSSSSWWIFFSLCVFLLSMSAADLVLFFFLFSTPHLPFCCGWEALYGSFFVFADVAWLCSKMKCLCCQRASPAGWDQVTDGMKMLCLYHPQAEELHSGVAHQFWISMGAYWERSVKQLYSPFSLCFLLVFGFFFPRFVLLGG